MKKRVFGIFFCTDCPKNAQSGGQKLQGPEQANLTGAFVNCGHGWAWKNSNCKKFLLQKPMILLELPV